MDYNNYSPYYEQQSHSLTTQVSAAMKLVYVKMTLAMLVTGLISYFCGHSPAYLTYMAQHSWVIWAIVIAQFAIVFMINPVMNKIGSLAGSLVFYLFAVLMGLWLAPIFVVYTGTSIAKTFFITAGTFAAMSIYGYTTSQDLTKFGNYLRMALFGLIIAIIVNIFTKSSTLDWIISFIGVGIFIGLTAWDTQQLKNMAAMIPSNQIGRLATIGALSLYLDFINLFLFLLRFFGGRND